MTFTKITEPLLNSIQDRQVGKIKNAKILVCTKRIFATKKNTRTIAPKRQYFKSYRHLCY